ncbi:MAG: CBS domain-containing protein [Polyangiales bacterium]
MTTFAKDHMTGHPWTVHAGETVEQAARIMHSHGLSHLPVLEDGSLVGVLDESELRLILAHRPAGKPALARDAMTPHPLIVGPETTLVEVARKMADGHHACAIVCAHGAIVGVLCVFDALRALSKISPGPKA